jgi:transaldolase
VAPDANLHRLHEADVSIWLDTLSGQLLQSGEFAALIRDFSVTGATSNPTIFAKAITGSDLYDDQSGAWPQKGNATRRNCSSRSRSTTSAGPHGSCARHTTKATGETGSSRLNAPRISPTTPTPRSPKPPTCGSASINRT